jgi:hypothetical protein
MREVPKAIITTPTGKPIGGTGLIAHLNGKSMIDVPMDNPQTAPNLVKVRGWSMSQRLPVEWVKRLTNADDPRRYSLIPRENEGTENVSAISHYNSTFKSRTQQQSPKHLNSTL